ncbi:hypothetical protein RJ55_05370 [Drechmeria coniospora]|nr:hypothetical protein RJ55_05370 [Drechmeria coniospora]
MMSSANEEDPFLQVQQDVLAQLASTRPLFASYQRIRSLSTAPSSPELASARADLESALNTLAEDLTDLAASVQAIEHNPAQFGISADEATRRKRLVLDVRREVDTMRDDLRDNQHHATTATSDLPDPSTFASVADDADPDGGSYAEFEQHQQLEMMREQDQHLDGVFHTVGNLRRQADDMGRELEEQHEMLELVDNAADRVGTRLQNGMQKLQHVMRQNEDRWSSCCIAVLIFVLILLLVLLLIV